MMRTMEEQTTYGCEEVLARLDNYLDQELPLPELRLVLAHLAHCPTCEARCQGAYEEMAQLRDRMQDYHTPDTLLQAIRANLAQAANMREQETEEEGLA